MFWWLWITVIDSICNYEINYKSFANIIWFYEFSTFETFCNFHNISIFQFAWSLFFFFLVIRYFPKETGKIWRVEVKSCKNGISYFTLSSRNRNSNKIREDSIVHSAFWVICKIFKSLFFSQKTWFDNVSVFDALVFYFTK